MDKRKKWFDRLIEQWCEALNNTFSGQRFLATVGYGMAGLKGMDMLPLDRRLGSNVIKMAGQNPWFRREGFRGGGKLEKETSGKEKFIVGFGTSPTEQNCGFWAYCHMSGQPCVWCGGSNNLSETKWQDPQSLCPQGTNAKLQWFGCCRNPQGKIRMIGFLDCCGHGWCSIAPWNKCSNFDAAKWWCAEHGQHPSFPDHGEDSYYCTVAVDQGGNDPCA
jgi:hypothetical protein